MKFIFSILVGLTLFACKSNNPVDTSSKLTQAKLLGPDYRKCMCCGGLKLSFDLNASMEQDSFYLVNEIVSNTIITDSTKYPLIVKIDWRFNEEDCKGVLKKVDILKIEK